jgi:hypothetical protein
MVMTSYTVKNPPQLAIIFLDTARNCFRRFIAQCFGGYRKERGIHPAQCDILTAAYGLEGCPRHARPYIIRRSTECRFGYVGVFVISFCWSRKDMLT